MPYEHPESYIEAIIKQFKKYRGKLSLSELADIFFIDVKILEEANDKYNKDNNATTE